MRTHIFRAEPGIKVTIEVKNNLNKVDALHVGRKVLHLHAESLQQTVIDVDGEDITYPRLEETHDVA